MKFDIKFTIIARCKRYLKDDNGNNVSREDILLNIDKDSAANFIFRFGLNSFIVKDVKGNEYKVNLRFNNMNALDSIILINNDYFYIVSNLHQVLADITEGYIRTRLLEKNSAMMEFDFETTLENNDNNIIDEFDLEENNN